jgi:hypothetical protein
MQSKSTSKAQPEDPHRQQIQFPSTKKSSFAYFVSGHSAGAHIPSPINAGHRGGGGGRSSTLAKAEVACLEPLSPGGYATRRYRVRGQWPI